MIQVTCGFDAGAIEVVRAASADAIDLRIRRDSHADFTQWFYFRLSGARGQSTSIRLLNAAQCTYPRGWEGYQAVASYDREEWFRVPTRYQGGVLTIEHVPERDSIYYAYFEPYSSERHLLLLGRAERSPRVRLVHLASTADGRDVDLVHIAQRQGAQGDGAGERRVWIIARQHPGETMAEWFVEGLIERLIDVSDPAARSALALASFYIVPNMNPDGSARGNLRTNARGANLNREWMNPSVQNSPEVLAVRRMMQAGGVTLFLDVHGDEALAYVFVAGSEMLPSFSPAQAGQQAAFVKAFKAVSPDFQDRHGYGPGKYSTDALKLASKWVGHEFGCLSLTLEMPFKDNALWPDPAVGWNGARSKRLGAAVLFPILEHLRALAQA
jgi:murein tripeptide amidase MpaA